MVHQEKILRRLPGAFWFVLALFFLSIVITFDGFLLNLGSHLSDSDQAALAFWHTWWGHFGFGRSEGIVINSYSNAPYLANHLGYMPLIQAQIAALLDAISGPILAFNIILLLDYALTYWSIYFLLKIKGISLIPSGLLAAAFVLSPWYYDVLVRADVILASVGLIVWLLFFWEKWLVTQKRVYSYLIFAGIAITILSGIQLAALLLSIWLPYVVWRFCTFRKETQNQAFLSDVTRLLWQIGVLVLILILIYPIPVLFRTLSGYEPAFISQEYAVPDVSIHNIILALGIGILMLLIGGIMFTKNYFDRVLLGLTGINLLIASGLLSSPDRLLLNLFNIPPLPLARLDTYLGGALIVAVIYAALAWEDKWLTIKETAWKYIVIAAALAVVSIFNVVKNYPHKELEIYPFYESIAAEPEDYLLLNYPFGIRDSYGQTIGQAADLVVYSAWHQKRTLSGINLFYPPELYAQFEQMRFLYPGQLASDEFAPAANNLTEAINTWRIGYVVIHTEKLSSEQLEAIQQLIRESDALCQASQQQGLLIYRAKWHPDGCE